MAETYKVLGQSNPAINTLTDAYTVPGGGVLSAVISSIVVANRTTGTIRYRISVAVGGAADSIKQYIFYDVSMANRTSDAIVLGITLSTTDVIRVRADDANVAFNIFGVEIS
jgi:hypothetical protein